MICWLPGPDKYPSMREHTHTHKCHAFLRPDLQGLKSLLKWIYHNCYVCEAISNIRYIIKEIKAMHNHCFHCTFFTQSNPENPITLLVKLRVFYGSCSTCFSRYPMSLTQTQLKMWAVLINQWFMQYNAMIYHAINKACLNTEQSYLKYSEMSIEIQ